MTKEDLLKKLDELETREFLINMVDRWTWRDKELLNETKAEIKEVKKLLDKFN